MGAGLSAAERDLLVTAVRGTVTTSTDARFAAAVAVWNSHVDQHPQVVVAPVDDDDVAAAVRAAARLGRTVSVRGGGHNVAGRALDGEIVLDLRGLREVSVDQLRGTVTVGGGATWADVDRITQQQGLAVPGGVVSTTGVGGLTLGGGMGWLRRAHGLSSDRLVGARVVLADGTLADVDEQHRDELLAALRGSGGGFAAVTRFVFMPARVGPEVAFAQVVYPLDQGEAVLRAYRDAVDGAIDEITSSILLTSVPPAPPFAPADRGRGAVIVCAMWSGDADEGVEALMPLARLGGVAPILSAISARSYVEVQSAFDAGYPSGSDYFWSSAALTGLTDDVIAHCLAQAAALPTPQCVVALWQLGGAMDVPPSGGSTYPLRGVPWLLGVEANLGHADDALWSRGVAWARATADRHAPFATGQGYVNLPGGDLPTPSAERRRFDPGGRFV